MDRDDDRATAAQAETKRLREESRALQAESEQAIRRSSQLCIRAQRIAARSYLLQLVGELDLVTVRDVQEELAALRPEAGDIALELAELEFIDSSGLRLLLDLTGTGDGVAPVRLLSPSPAVMRLVELTGTAGRLGL